MCEMRDEKNTYSVPNIYMLVSYVQLKTHQVATSYGIIRIHLTVILVTVVWLCCYRYVSA